MHRRLCALFLLALPHAALAVDLFASVELGTSYDSNVFNEDENDGDGLHAEHDIAASLQPNIRLSQAFARGSTSLNYYATLQRYFLNRDIREREIDDNHFGTWDFEYALSRRTKLTLSDTIESTLNRDFGFERSTANTQNGQLDEEVQGRNTVNVAAAELEHAFTRRLTVSLGGSHQIFRSQDEDQVESQAFGAESGLRYQLSSDHTIGISSSVSTQFYERFLDPDGAGTAEAGDDVLVPASRSIFASGQATWVWQVLPETQLSIAAGPAWVYTRREERPTCFLTDSDPNTPGFQTTPPVPGDGCPSVRDPFDTTPPFSLADTNPGVVPATSTDRLTVFAAASINQRIGENFRARLSYNRSEAAAQGTSGSSVRDVVNGSLTWQVSERADLALIGSWNQRNSATDLDTRTNRGQIDSSRWSVGARGGYQLTRKLALRGQATYGRQHSDVDSFQSVGVNNQITTTTIEARDQGQVRASLGLVYTFDRQSFLD